MFENLPTEGSVEHLIITGLVLALIAYMVNQHGAAVFKVLLWPIHKIIALIHGKTARFNFLSLSFKTYKRHVGRSNLAFMENPVGPGLHVPLEQAFSPLRLISAGSQDPIEFQPYVAGCNRMIVLGGPGAGKTTIMKSLMMSILSGKCHEELNDKVPVFIVLRNLAAKGHSVEEAILAAFEHHNFPGAGKFIDTAMDKGRLVVILDGLDEVGDRRDAVVQAIQAFCDKDVQRDTPNRVLVTCREYSYQSADLRSEIPNELRVEEFSDHHMRIFLKGWPSHEGRSALNVMPLIQANPQIQLVCRNPLILTILAGLYLDIEDFELPKTRKRFLEEAVLELLERRPQRRGQAQKFRTDDKMNLLARASLARIEGHGEDHDPERLNLEFIHAHAKEVILDDFKVRDLEKELIDVNGILKPLGDGNFTFNHRTFQEFFAAREAHRIRDVRQALETFSYKGDLSEVLKLYCGLITNVPQMNQVLSVLAQRGDWLLAAECLTNMAEVPEVARIEEITAGLYEIAKGLEFQSAANLRAVAILSYLSTLKDPAFASAGDYFERILEGITAGGGENEKPAVFEFLLSKNPAAAERLIPNFVHAGPPEWRRAAVRLLGDLGTQSAMDDLVRLLNGPPSPEREEAARLVSGLIMTNRDDMAQRVNLVPEISDDDRRLWPLERYFPARLALAVARAAGAEGTKSRAIDVLVKLTRGELRQDRINDWMAVGRTYRMETVRSRLLSRLPQYVAAIYVVILLLLTGGGFYLDLRDEYATVALQPFEVSIVDRAKLEPVSTAAAAAVAALKLKYPAHLSRWESRLPWNWSENSGFPSEESEKFFRDLERISTIPSRIYDKISEFDGEGGWDLELRKQMVDLEVASEPSILELYKISLNLENSTNAYYIILYSDWKILLTYGFFIINTVVFINVIRFVSGYNEKLSIFGKITTYRVLEPRSYEAYEYKYRSISPIIKMLSVCLLQLTFGLFILIGISYGNSYILLGMYSLSVFGFFVLFSCFWLPWSNNRHLLIAFEFLRTAEQIPMVSQADPRVRP